MRTQPVFRDERTVIVENTSYRLAYVVMSFGLLAIIAYRSLVLQQNSWELLAVILAGGLTAALYQGFKQIITPRWSIGIVAAGIGAAMLAFILMLILN